MANVKYDHDMIINIIWQHIINGKSRYEILNQLKNGSLEGVPENVKTGNIKRYYEWISQAYNLCKTELQEKREEERALLFNRFLSVYEDATAQNDNMARINALKELGKITGSYDPVEMKHNITIDFKLEDESSDEES